MDIKKAPASFSPKPLSSKAQELSQKLRQGAQMYEKHFLHEMVKAMRKSVHHSRFTQPSMAEKIYQEQLDSQYVDQWIQAGGTGLTDVIYKDLIHKFYPQLQTATRKSQAGVKDD